LDDSFDDDLVENDLEFLVLLWLSLSFFDTDIDLEKLLVLQPASNDGLATTTLGLPLSVEKLRKLDRLFLKLDANPKTTWRLVTQDRDDDDASRRMMGRPISNLWDTKGTTVAVSDALLLASMMEATWTCALTGRMGERREINARRAVLAQDLGEIMAVEEEGERVAAWGDGGMARDVGMCSRCVLRGCVQWMYAD
jgi:hypothetical protein